MAEERLIDDDLNKDKKYKIRKNADGEDELYIDDSSEELYEVPELLTDDESAANLTPSEYAERERELQKKRESAAENFKADLAAAEQKYGEGDFSGALQKVNSALSYSPANGGANALKLLILTQNFNDFSNLEECVTQAELVKANCNPDEKERLISLSKPLVEKIYKKEEHAAELHVKVEQGKAERREVFQADKKRALMLFSIAFIPFIVCFALAIGFAAVMFANKQGLNLILALVFGALALIFLILTAVFARKLWWAMKKLSLNSQNSSTQIGRDYMAVLDEIKSLKRVLNGFSDDV